jgi:TRAP-type C4-dicarboxylate transport system substrate-binding protein
MASPTNEGGDMKRFAMFAGAALAVVLIAFWEDGAVTAAAPIRIKLATLAPKDTSYHRILLEMGEKWRKATDGQINLVIYPGGTQGSEADIVKRMNVGELQAAMLSIGGLTEIDPAVGALQEIPMLFHSLAEEEFVLDRLRPELEKRLLAKGFVALFWGDSGWVRLFSRNAALHPNDFKTMKIFVTSSGSAKQMQIMQALGYKPVPLDIADALIQLQTGGVDAVPTVPLFALAAQYYTVTKHMVELNWAPLVGATVITKQTWDAVPQDVRDTLLEAAAHAGKTIQQASRQENEQAVTTMTTRFGLQVHTLTPPIEDEWRQFAEGIYPKIRGTMVPADMFDQARQRVSEYRASRGDRK